MKRGGRRYKHLFKWLGGNTIKSQSTAKVEFKDAPETRTIQPKPRAKRTREPKPQYSADSTPSTRCRFINGTRYRPWDLTISSTVKDVFSEADKFYGKEPRGLLYRVEGETDDLLPCMLKNTEDFEIFKLCILRDCPGLVDFLPYD
ncbi:hypothetical protein PCH_Pc24g00690 [Penicillium rubens Wisconsin 54-1255]|uniref:Uncharacterized protein n=1 Tax=Penicillium rubens (strain ATCC 28089 / DSM 1075 / NRRL 1951 / Wisconsin 54-1255) TaxID=500485 RepID=B6HWM7_PENRW|nr:hypothetical protein PCH_Pc24g00690 [Penicillium rubens Wisconsin 54-1255]